MIITTIKVDAVTRDRLKTQAAAAHRTLGAHLLELADLADRRDRADALRRAIASTSPEHLASYAREFAEWEDAN